MLLPPQDKITTKPWIPSGISAWFAREIPAAAYDLEFVTWSISVSFLCFLVEKCHTYTNSAIDHWNKNCKEVGLPFTFRHTSPPVQNLSHVFESTVDHTFLMEQLMEARLKDDTTAKEAQAGHPAKSSKPREFNYRVHFIHWRKSLY